MKSTLTPHTHTGVTAQSFTTRVGPSGYTLHVPAGLRCHKLEGGSNPWVVDDLSFVPGLRNGILYSDASIYGVRVPEDFVSNIAPVAKKFGSPSWGDDLTLASAQIAIR